MDGTIYSRLTALLDRRVTITEEFFNEGRWQDLEPEQRLLLDVTDGGIWFAAVPSGYFACFEGKIRIKSMQVGEEVFYQRRE